ncbi:MAG: AMED_5909 family protein [Candidatus Dormibacteria bacterium]
MSPGGVETSGGDNAVEQDRPPRSLAEAHEAVARIRPRQKAPLSDWLAFHQRSAAVYAEVAEIDRGHHHEALFMVERERHRVTEIKTEMASSTTSEK